MESSTLIDLGNATTTLRATCLGNQSNSCMNMTGDPMKSTVEVALWSLPYLVIVFLGFWGNFIVCWVIVAHGSMRSVTNYFLFNLSVSDIMYTSLNIPWYFATNVNGHWLLGPSTALCKLVRCVAPASAAASIYSLMAISIDRYMAIVHPLSHQLTRKKAIQGVVAIWAGSLLTALPQVLFARVSSDSGKLACAMVFPDGRLFGAYFLLTKVAQLIVTFVIPGAVIGYTYLSIARELWKAQRIGESTSQRQINSKQKIVKMMIVLVVVFLVTMLPQHLVILTIALNPSLLDHVAAISHTWLGVTLLANSNVMYNPFIYCYMNHRYRVGFGNFFRKLSCRPMQDIDRANRDQAAVNQINANKEARLTMMTETRMEDTARGKAHRRELTDTAC